MTTWQDVLNGKAEWSVECADAMVALPSLPPGRADAVIVDPPYGISYQSAWRTDRSKWKPKIANDGQPFIWWLRDAAMALADGGALVCFCRWDVQEAFRLAITWAGLKVRAQIVWDRMSHGAGDTAGSPAPQHDVIWYATKGRRVFQGERPKSIIRAMRLSGDELTHPNEKPLPLLGSLVESYSTPGGLVIDPFCGSGTTGVACLQNGRRFLGCDIAEKYVALSRSRLKNDAPLFAAATKDEPQGLFAEDA